MEFPGHFHSSIDRIAIPATMKSCVPPWSIDNLFWGDMKFEECKQIYLEWNHNNNNNNNNNINNRTWLIFEPSKMWSHQWSRLPSNQREPRRVHPLHPGRSVFIRDCSFRRSSIGWSLVGQASRTQESNWAAWKDLSSRRSPDAQIRSECAETDVHSQDFTVFW